MSRATELAAMLTMGPEYAAACRTLSANELRRLDAVNAELLEALRGIHEASNQSWIRRYCREAIAKAEAQQ